MIAVEKTEWLIEQGKRENIEDYIYPQPGNAGKTDRLFLVCDGVGGENKGEEASRIAAEGFAGYFTNFLYKNEDDAPAYLRQAQGQVVDQMKQYIVLYPEAAKMSTTLTLVYILDDKILAAWCGDSRIYHCRDGEILWRSTDHSMVSMLVQRGEISEKEAESHPQKNIILRSISADGNPSEIEVHWITDVQNDDYILLCTDGVLEQITESRLQNILSNTDNDKKELFLDFCRGKTSDNYSLYLLKLQGGHQAIKNKSGKTKSKLLVVSVILLIICLLLGCWLFYKNYQHTSKKDNKKSSIILLSNRTNTRKVL